MRTLLFLLSCLVTFPLSAQQPTSEQVARVQRGDSLRRVFKQQPDGGITMALQHVKAEPRNPFAYLVLADVYATKEQYPQAIKAYRQGYKYVGKGLTFERRILLSMEANTHLAAGDTLACYRLFDKVLNQHPHHDWFNLRYAELSEQQGKIAQARTYYRRGVLSGNLNNRMALANFELRQENYVAAIAQYDSVRSVNPLNPELVERLPRALIAAGEYDRAFPLVFDHVGSTGAAYPSLVAIRYLYQAQPERVMSELQKRRLERPRQSAWPIAEGYLHGAHQRTFEAVQCYQTAWDLEPNSALDELLVWGYDALAQPERTLLHLERLSDDEIANADYIAAQKTRLFFEAGRFEEALTAINAYIAENDTLTQRYAQRMNMLMACHRDAEALADCEYLLIREPHHYRHHYTHGRLLHSLGREKEAQQAFEKAAALILEATASEAQDNQKSKDQLFATLNFVYFYLGKREEALRWFDARMDKQPTPGEIYDAACLHALLGNQDRAMTYLRAAMEAGYLHIFHIQTDRDLESLHSLPEFQQLIHEYHEKIKRGEIRR